MKPFSAGVNDSNLLLDLFFVVFKKTNRLGRLLHKFRPALALRSISIVRTDKLLINKVLLASSERCASKAQLVVVSSEGVWERGGECGVSDTEYAYTVKNKY